MGCFKPKTKNNIPKTSHHHHFPPDEPIALPPPPMNPQTPKTLRQETLLCIPGCTVHLMDEGEAVEIAAGDFTLLLITDQNVPLATIVKVGDHLQWPVTKDEPVVKLDTHHYLFSLPMKVDGEDPLSYGVTFSVSERSHELGLLDSFLAEHSCFSGASAERQRRGKELDWKAFAPKIENYNNVLARAIAGGTGHIVKGIFSCSNAYTSQVLKGGEVIQAEAQEERKGVMRSSSSFGGTGPNNNTDKTGLNKSLKRVRKVTKMTEKMSKSVLDMVGVASGSVMGPVVNSKPGKAFFSMLPGEVLLASFDAVNKVLDAAEAAEKQAFSATSTATTRMVSQRFGESAGEATGDALATAGHCAGTAWNVFKIRKAVIPSKSATSGIVKAASKSRTGRL